MFPILLHELAKGVVELMSLWSLPQDADDRAYVLNKTDHLEAETNDIRLGPSLWSKFVAEIPVDNQEVISLTWHKLQEIPDSEFNSIVEGLLNDQEQARNTVREIANESISELNQEAVDDKLGTDDDYEQEEEEDMSDPVLDPILDPMGGDEPEPEGEPNYEEWDVIDLRRAFDQALDDGNMDLVRHLGGIINSK